jgi:hypothetical protein
VESPGSPSIDIRHLTAADAFDVDALLRHNDGVILPREIVRGYPGVDLIDDRWVCIVDQANDAVADHVTVEHLESLPLVSTYSRRDPCTTPRSGRCAGSGWSRR